MQNDLENYIAEASGRDPEFADALKRAETAHELGDSDGGTADGPNISSPYPAREGVEKRILGQANYLLARIVAAANLGAVEGEDGFIKSYNLPVGPIHKAIPFLQEQGIVVTLDGQIHDDAVV